MGQTIRSGRKVAGSLCVLLNRGELDLAWSLRECPWGYRPTRGDFCRKLAGLTAHPLGYGGTEFALRTHASEE